MAKKVTEMEEISKEIFTPEEISAEEISAEEISAEEISAEEISAEEITPKVQNPKIQIINNNVMSGGKLLKIGETYTVSIEKAEQLVKLNLAKII